MSFTRIAPDRTMSTRAASASVLAQDVIQVASRLFEGAYELDAIARPNYSNPCDQLVRSESLWNLQLEITRELHRSRNALTGLQAKLDAVTKPQFE